MTCAARSSGSFLYAVSTTAARVQRRFLPDLTACLDDLLRAREQLAAVSSVNEWARTAAVPSGQEISKIRQLIDRIKGGIAGLPWHERARIEEAVTVARTYGSFSLGMPRLRQQAG